MKKNSNHIDKEWRSFAEGFIDADDSEASHMLFRTVFYAGAASMFRVLLHSLDDDASMDDTGKLIDEVEVEMNAFSADGDGE